MQPSRVAVFVLYPRVPSHLCMSLFIALVAAARFVDPRGQPTVTAGSDHYLPTCCLSVRPSVPTFQNLAKQNNFQLRIMIASDGAVGAAEWIIASAAASSFVIH